MTSTAGVTHYAYDAANRLVLSEVEGLTSVNGQAYTWDNNPTSLRSGDWRGNLTNDGNREYTYDQANRLIAVSDQQSAISFAYNGDPLHCVRGQVGHVCGKSSMANP